MYIIDGIAYADDRTPMLTVLSARPLKDHKLWLRFSTGEERIFNFKPLLNSPCFQPLKDEAVFHGVYVDDGVPVWMDGKIDIAPETVYENGSPVKKPFKDIDWN